MKAKLVSMLAIVLFTLAFNAECSENKHESEQLSVSLPVKSKAELELLALQPSPLDLLSKQAKQRFIDGVVFTDRGIGSYYYKDLEIELTSVEKQSVLSLIGIGNTSATNKIDDANVESRNLKRATFSKPQTNLSKTSRSALSISKCPNESTIDDYYIAIEKLNSDEFDVDIAYEIDNKTLIKRSLYDNLESFYASCFKSYVKNIKLQELDSTKLHKLFGIVYKVNFYTPKLALTEAAKNILDEKQKRGENITLLLPQIHQSYLKLRLFDKAKDFATQYPDIELSVVPSNIELLTTNKVKSTYQLDNTNSEQRIVQKEIEADNEYQIVVVSSPACNPSNRFLKWLHQPENEKIKNAFMSNSLFLVPPSGSLFLSKWEKINSQYPEVKMQLSHSKSQWPEIGYWATPTMYFYKKGKLFSQLIGWPPEGREEELIIAMKELELL